MVAGVIVNAWLLPGFEPVFDPVRSLDLLDAGERLQPTIGNALSQVSMAALVALAILGTWRRLKAFIRSRSTGSGSDDSCCSG